MDKRLAKRHKRQVERARAQVRLSEPDLRTPEEKEAAKEATRPAAGRPNDPHAHYSNPAIRTSSVGRAAKADA